MDTDIKDITVYCNSGAWHERARLVFMTLVTFW